MGACLSCCHDEEGLPTLLLEEYSMPKQESKDDSKCGAPGKAQGELMKPGAITGQNNSRFVVLDDGHLKYYTNKDKKEMKGDIDLRYYHVLPKNPADAFSVSTFYSSM